MLKKSKKLLRFFSATLVIVMAASVFSFAPVNADSEQPIATTTSPYTAEKPLKLLCIGDSITHGCGTPDEEVKTNYHTSYRYPLWKKFIDNNYNVEFVGNRNMNFDQNCKEVGEEYKGHIFNNKHEAHYGITLYDILNGYTPSSKNENTKGQDGNYIEPIKKVPPLKDEISNLDFDAVIINLGTNPYKKADGTNENDLEKIEKMKQVIGVLREKNPKVIIYLTQLIISDTYSSYNAGLQKIADTMSTTESPLICMRTRNPRWKTTNFRMSYLTDGVHPNAMGDDYLSEVILNAMKPLLDGAEDITKTAEPFAIVPVEKPIKPKKVKLLTKKITTKTKVIKGKTNVKDADIIVKAGKKVIRRPVTNGKGIFTTKVNLSKFKAGTILSIQVKKYYEAYDYTEIIKKSTILKVKIKKK